MAIVKMMQFTLFTFHGRRGQLLRELQQFGDLHMRGLNGEELGELDFLHPDISPGEISHWEAEREKVGFCLELLGPHAPKRGLRSPTPTMSFGEFERFAEETDYGSLYQRLREEDAGIGRIKGEITKLRAENDALTPWRKLDVSPEELEELGTVEYFLGTVNKNSAQELRDRVEEASGCAYVEFLEAVKDAVGVLVLAPAGAGVSEVLRDVGFSKLGFAMRGRPAQAMEQNRKEIEALEKELEEAAQGIAALGDRCGELEIVLDAVNTLLERERVRRNFLGSRSVLMIQGWVPRDNRQRFEEILDGVCPGEYYLEAEEVDKDDGEVPVKLRHNRLVEPFSDITTMYSTPRYNEIDPTPILTPFYIVFFGLMVGDIGYGLLLMLGTAVALKVFHLKEGTRKFMRFFFILSFSVIAAGFLYGGMFGVEVFAPISYETVAADGTVSAGMKPILSTGTDINSMLIYSIALGVVHIFTALIVKMYMCFRDGKPLDALFDGFLWIVCLTAGIGFLLGIMGVAVQGVLLEVCKWGFVGSLVLLALTQGREYKTIGGKLGGGLYGVYGITSYVGDFISYTRLVALALSGAYIGMSFNMMAGLIPAGPAGIVRIIFGGIIIIAGQAINFGLSLLSAYVHTCRLQYVEFFGKFFEGGGVPFAPFRLNNEHVQVKD